MVSSQRLSSGFGELAGSDGLHLCHIFDDDDERGRMTSRFVEQSLVDGAKVLCLEDAATPGRMRELLTGLGVDMAGRERAFLSAIAEETYCPTGRFVPDDLLVSFAGFCRQAVDEGYNGVRILGDMRWVVRRNIDREPLLEYETKATAYSKGNRVVAVCEYDARAFDGRTIMDILSVHPAMLVHGQIVRNPHYTEPERSALGAGAAGTPRA